MDDAIAQEAATSLLTFLPFTLAVIALLYWHGLSLRNAPPRNLKLGLVPLLIGLAAMFGGTIVAQWMFLAVNNLRPGDVQAVADPLQAMFLIVTQLGAILGVAMFLTFWWTKHTPKPAYYWRVIGIVPRQPAREILFAGVGVVVLLIIYFNVTIISVTVAAMLGFDTPTVGHELLRAMRDSDSHVVLTLLILAAVVLAPISEEFIYRGFVQSAVLNMLAKQREPHHRWLAIIITSALFATLHLGAVAWQALPGLFVVGVVVGWLYERTGSLLTPILVHMGFNGLMVTVTLYAPNLS